MPTILFQQEGDERNTPCLAAEYPGIGSPMYPAVDEIMTIEPFLLSFLKKWTANLTAAELSTA